MFLRFRSIVRRFQCFVRDPSPFGKYFPMTLPPYRSEITALEPPLPLGISDDLPWRRYGYFLELSPFIMHFFNFRETINQLLFDCYPILIIVFIY